jgi:DNA helicase-2/ATP-dependent DNA helicase PcrA
MNSELDQHQQIAVLAESPICIIAGAGSGKTRSLTARVIHKIFNGTQPARLLMLTFSRKACREMSDRINQSIDLGGGKPPLILTYHALGYRIVRERPDLCRRKSNPTLLDDSDIRRMMTDSMRLHGLDRDDFKAAIHFYNLVRNEGLSFENPDDMSVIHSLAAKNTNEPRLPMAWRDAFSHYEACKRTVNVVDYNDLQVLPLLAFRADAAFLAAFSARFDEIFVDEVQDTNKVQYELLRLIGEGVGGHIVVVGDDDQTIYSWRGAESGNMARFIKDFDAKKIFLSLNYRSLPNIVEQAGKLIAHNKDRIDKTPVSARALGNDPLTKLLVHEDGRDMARQIAGQISKAISAGDRPSDFAVLYRTNWMAHVLESEFMAHGIEYRIKKGMEINQRQENQMIFALIRLMMNPDDYPAFLRIAQMIPGLGDKRAEQVFGYAQDLTRGDILAAARANFTKNADYQAAIQRVTDGMNKARAEGITPIRTVQDWADLFPDYGVWLDALVAKAVDAESGAARRYSAQSTIDAMRGMLENLKVLDSPIFTPIDHWALVMEMGLSSPEDEASHQNVVTLSTIHGAKGLEWKHVHLAGFSEGLMPINRGDPDAPEAENGIDEERRTAYVGMTRAKNQLVLHHANRIYIHGEDKRYSLSRFVREADINVASAADQPKKAVGSLLQSRFGAYR